MAPRVSSGGRLHLAVALRAAPHQRLSTSDPSSNCEVWRPTRIRQWPACEARDRACSVGFVMTGRSRERIVLDRLIGAVRAGQSRALVLSGEPGVGKTALLEYIVEQAPECRLARTAGVQSEMELVFAGLHQLLAPMLDYADRLPSPQRDALRTAFGLGTAPAPDRFLIGLAALSLLSEVAAERPLICLVDDEQWLDRASAQILSFVARRLDEESVALVFAARETNDDLVGLPELVVGGLREGEARELLESMLAGPLDARVRDQIVSESRGNPLALLEMVRNSAPAELAGGFGLPSEVLVTSRIEESFRRRLDGLPCESRNLVRLAAADPLGDPVLVWRAAERLGIPADASAPATASGLLEFGPRVRFCHPLMRSAAYRSSSPEERREHHRALAAVTDPKRDPDRRAWHRAQATTGPDAEVAQELEESADRAQARGGAAAAAAFLERSGMLTPEPALRAQRLLAAAKAKRDAGALDAALGLLVAVEAGPLVPLQAAELQHQRGQIAFDQRRAADAVRLLLDAAQRLEPLGADSARETHLEAMRAAIWAADLTSPGDLRKVAEAARAAPSGPALSRAVDVRLDAFAVRFTDGYAAAVPLLTRSLELSLALPEHIDQIRRSQWLVGSMASDIIATELWDAEALHVLSSRQVQFARHTGALVQLQFALNLLAWSHLLAGESNAAVLLLEEDRLIAEATGNPEHFYAAIGLAAWQGQEAEASELIQTSLQEAKSRGLGRIANYVTYASSVLHNGVGRHDAARDAALQAFEADVIGFGCFIVPELAEAASRTGDEALVETALEWLGERTRAIPSEWALGIEALVRALIGSGDAADQNYRQSIALLGKTRLRVQLARAHLLYGEWLRRERRMLDARAQLRTAHSMLDSMGIEAFAERARRELLATGETARKRTVETHHQLTPQEARIAQLAREGLSNPEIGTRLFISPRTVQYHLRKVFIKLDITSRSELGHVLPSDSTKVSPG
jgi:DNA-binding CsgD family transcriptional regulator